MALLLKKVERPRELTWYQAAGMLYGDWGTSKAYVLCLAFFFAGHASMFILLAMSVLTAIVGFCYVIVCREYPDGGGVYSAVLLRSKTLAVVGALLLIAGYVVTAALSSVEAFHYLGWARPELWAIGALALIGFINVVGPTKTGNVATLIALVTVGVLAVLCAVVLLHVHKVQITPPEGSIFSNWSAFVAVVLALSGVESIANTTGIMVEPVRKTARRAILTVLLEVTVVSLILGAAMNAIPGLEGRTEDMIRAIGEYYVGPWFGHVVALAMAFLLLSACNTAIMAMVSVMFLLSKDRELPPVFSDLNRYGMPWLALFVAVFVPCLTLAFENEVTHLAALYAIGVVGAITINIGACATNGDLAMPRSERWLLMATFAVMLLIELTIVVEKPNAVIFASSVLVFGLAARTIAKRVELARLVVPEVLGINVLTLEEARDLMPLYKGSTLVALKTLSPTLLDEAAVHARGRNEKVVYAYFVEEKPPGWAYPKEVEPSRQSVEVLSGAVQEFEKRGLTAVPLWNLGDNPGGLIVKAANELGLETVMIGTTRRGAFERFLRGGGLKRIGRA